MKNVYYRVLNFFRKLPKATTIDRSGIVNSDLPREGNGWLKGWVRTRSSVVVCRHGNPAVGQDVFVISSSGNKIVRSIASIEIPFPETDIAICKLDVPFPDVIKVYPIASKLTPYQKTITFKQSGTPSFAAIRSTKSNKLCVGRDRKPFFTSGDSGTPWFVWEDSQWKVVTHTHLGDYGVGPWYAELGMV
jgi:hypothetical protein